MPRILRAIVTSVVLASSAQAGVVINEILYRPGTTVPFTVENPATEFIELYNTDVAPVNIGGWALKSGVSYTIPANTMIPANGYVVIAANPAALQTRYGFVGALGPWQAGSALSNGSERVRLSKPGLTAGSFDKVDDVTYASEGDWAPRVREATFGGYDWSSPATSGGNSIELRNPALSNDNGQNWAASTAGAGATPGAVNSVATGNIAPIIKAVKHSPAVPKTTDPIRITCELNDETPAAGLTANLLWRDATTTTPPGFTTTSMLHEGNGKFAVTLPPQTTNLTVIEFYISATDGVNTRAFPAPVGAEGQVANCNIQVNNETRNATDTFYDMVLTGSENATLNSTQPNDSIGNKIDRQFNITFISSRAGESSIRYRSSVRFRGNSSRGYTVGGVYFKPLRISIPNDDTLDGLTDFAINPKASFTQYFGNRVLEACGVRTPDSLPVELRRNGVELTTSSGSTPDFGKWSRIEEFNGDFTNNHWPTATGGNLYKKGRPDQFWRTGAAVPGNPDGLLDGWSKQNNSSANDWTDMTSFFAVVQTVCAPHFTGAPAGNVSQGTWDGTPLSAAEIAQLETVADLDQWARWFAAMTVLQDNETNISNGQDDDYTIYFAPNALGQRRLNLVPHDLDTIFGLGDGPLAGNARGLYDMTAEGSVFSPLLPLIGNSITTGNAVFRQKYLDALRELLGTVFDAGTFGPMTDRHLGGWAPPATITAIKSFVSTRRAHLLDLIPDGVVGGSVATVITPPTATSTATLAATGTGVVIHEVLANNVTAYTNGATHPDVIELRNTSGAQVDISGMTLSDDAATPAKYTFPANTTINANAFLVVHADSDLTAPGLHTGFQLDQDGDEVLLYASAANGGALRDSVAFGAQPRDYSVGRTGGALNTWALCTPTIGTANTAVASLASPAILKINEWGPNPDYLLSGDFAELYNPSPQPAPIGAMAVTDDPINYRTRHVFPVLSFIAPGGFMRLNARGNSASATNSTELAFGFSSSFGRISLIGANGTTVDEVPVIGQPRDTSTGRSPDGATTLMQFSLPTTPPTPGASNIAPPGGVLNLLSFLRVTEVLFRPNDLEFIELQNIGGVTLDLSGVQFTSGISYTFDAGVTLAPGAIIVVCKDRAAFIAQYGALGNLAARNFTGTLDNAGESIALQPAPPWNINILNFTYNPDWFVDPTLDHSFTTVSPGTSTARDWSEKETWKLSTQSLGTPGNDGPPTITSSLTASAVAGASFSYQITGTKFPTSFGATGLPAGSDINTATGVISGAPMVDGVFEITVSATNSAGSDSKSLVLTISIPPPPVITSALSVSGSINVPLTYQIVGTNGPTSYNATGLPAWLSVNTTTGVLTGTPPAVGSFQVTIGAANFGGSDSETLSISVFDVGPFDHFEWSAVTNPQIANTPFPVTLRAVDSSSRTVNYNGPVNVGAAGVSSMGVVFTEFGCSTPTPDYFEIQNLGNTAVNTSGWFVMTGRNTQGVNVVNTVSWALPANLVSGQIVGATDNATIGNNETAYGADIDWPGNGPKGWAMLSDAAGVIRDFCAWGYTAAELSTINFTYGGFTYTLGSQWTGDGAAIPLGNTSLFRTGNSDANDASNWSIAASPSSASVHGLQNAGLSVGGMALAMQPVNAVLTNGVWTGDLSILDVADARLTASAAGTPVGVSNIFTLGPPTVNTPPLFTKGPNQTVPMDSGTKTDAGWATAIRAGASTETSQLVSFVVAADNTAIFAAQPAISSAGQLTFTPAMHATGSATVTVTPKDDGGTAGGGIDTGSAQTFVITIQPNVAPSFVKGTNLMIGEDAAPVSLPGWATAISAGSGESGQTVSFLVTNTDNTLFTAQPAVASDGTLTFSLAGKPGLATVFVTAMDNGGTTNGGTNSSAAQSFTVTISAVNHAPTFTPGANVSVRHNDGAQTIAGWATGISAGPASEAGQTLTFEVSASRPDFFIVQPSISPETGSLTFTPHPGRSGTATITATLHDDGGTANGGVDSVTNQFTITTRPVNDAPSFTAPAALSVGVGSAYSKQWATNIVKGPADESGQTVSFLVSNDRPELFTSAPSVLPTGVLSFTTANLSGTAVLTIRLKDSGGVLDGGVDESPAVTLTVQISSALEAVGNYYALVEPDVGVTRTNDNVGFTKITISKGGNFSGAITLGGQKFSLRGKLSDTGAITFSGGNNSTVLDRKILSDLILTMQLQLGDNPSLSASVKPAGGAIVSRFSATRPAYNGKTALVPTTILDPLIDKGKHSAALLALSARNNGLSAAQYPQGDGIGALTVSKTGGVTLKGKLADGTAFSMASVLLAGDIIPLYVPLYKSAGSLSGIATARAQLTSDVNGAGFFWFRPPVVKPAHPGWPGGINVDLIATKLLPKATPLFPTLGATDADGNATVDLTDATLGTKAVNIDAKNKVVVIAPGADKLKVTASAASGKWSGSFVSPVTGKPVKFSGVILRKAGYATGYYLDGIPGGRVQLAPAP